MSHARRSTHKFGSVEAEEAGLFKQYPIYTHSASKPEFEQTYYLHL